MKTKHNRIKTLLIILSTCIAALTLFAGKAKIYWGNHRDDNTSGIWRMNPDGSGTELVIEGYRPYQNVEEGKVGPVVCTTIDPRNRQIYFGEVWPADMLRRVNHDGSGLTTLWPARTTAVALDTGNNKIYFGNTEIRRANMDISDVEVVVAATPSLNGLALDIGNNHIYWTQGHSLTGTIMRINLDGSGATTIVGNIDAPRGIALDLKGGKIYWTTRSDGSGTTWLRATLQRSNLNGTGIEILLKGQNSNIAAPLTAYFSSPGNIALNVDAGFIYIGGCCRIFKVAMDASSCERIIPDAGGTKDAWALGVYLPPSGTMITTF